MKKTSKRYRALPVPPVETAFSFDTALDFLLAAPSVKFDETVELCVNLNLQKKHTIRDTVTFPHSFGKSKIVLVFAKDEKAEEARKAQADFVGSDDLIEKIQKGWLDFEVAIATPDLMKSIARIARVLGTRGLMPNPKAKTVTPNVGEAVSAIKAGRKEFRANENGVVNFAVGKKSMQKKALLENIRFFYQTLVQKKPLNLKGDYIKSAFLSSTMGRGLRLNLRSLS